jgi:hypothetical protein
VQRRDETTRKGAKATGQEGMEQIEERTKQKRRRGQDIFRGAAAETISQEHEPPSHNDCSGHPRWMIRVKSLEQ